MGKRIVNNFAFYLFLFAVIIIPFGVKAEVSTTVSLSCDKTELNFGQSTNCYVVLGSSDKLSEWYGKITVGNGLNIDSVTSLNKNYTIIRNQDSLVLSASSNSTPTEVSPSIQKIEKQKIIQIKVTANKNANVSNSNISIQTLQNCDNNLMGDLDADGDIDKDDALLALQISVKKVAATDYHLTVGNLNDDDVINASDALIILQIAVDKIDTNNYENIGDADNDGDVDKNDAQYVLEYSVGKLNLTDAETTALKQVADLDGNNKLDASDALIILQIVNDKKNMSDVIVGEKYLCYDVNKNLSSNNSSVNFKLSKSVNVPATGGSLSILLSVLSICLVIVGIMLITKTKKERTQE